MIRIIMPSHSREELPRKLRKWFDLPNWCYIAVCKKGCHGLDCDSYGDALTALRRLDRDCDDEDILDKF